MSRHMIMVAAVGCGACFAPVDGEEQTTSSEDPFVKVTLGTVVDDKSYQVAVGPEHVCRVHSCGVQCEGNNALGQAAGASGCGVDPRNPGAAASSCYRHVTVGDAHSCALTKGGEVTCWGDNRVGQINVAPYKDFRQIDAGPALTCGVRRGGAVACWGGDDGETNHADRVTDELDGHGTKFRQVSVGGSAGQPLVCAVTDHGDDIHCVGAFTGPGPSSRSAADNLRYASSGEVWSTVSVGGEHICARSDALNIYCWGNDASEQVRNTICTGGACGPLAMVPANPNAKDIYVFTGANRLSVEAGDFGSCEARSNAGVQCWGVPFRHQGKSMHTYWGPAFRVPNDHATQVSVGFLDACLIDDRQQAICWGQRYGARFPLGRATCTQPWSPPPGPIWP